MRTRGREISGSQCQHLSNGLRIECNLYRPDLLVKAELGHGLACFTNGPAGRAATAMGQHSRSACHWLIRPPGAQLVVGDMIQRSGEDGRAGLGASAVRVRWRSWSSPVGQRQLQAAAFESRWSCFASCQLDGLALNFDRIGLAEADGGDQRTDEMGCIHCIPGARSIGSPNELLTKGH